MQIDRKVWAGGLSGLAGAALVWAAHKFLGVDIDPTTAVGLVTIAAGAVAYLVPPHIQDVLRHTDEDLKKLAGAPTPLVVFLAAGILSLQACAPQPDGTVTLTPQAQQVVNVACAFDNVGQPVVTQVVAIAFPAAGPLLTLDQLLAHPLAMKACAQYGGKPLAVAPATTAAPAATP